MHIIGEHFERVNHHLLGLPGTTLAQIRSVKSHVQALSQCRNLIRRLGIEPIVTADTAGAAAEIVARGDPSVAAIASELAGKIYGLISLKENVEDAEHNTTRFLIMSHEALRPQRGTPAVTTFLFRVRNVPAALYKALGGFATNGINMTKLESYMVGGAFTATQFYADVEAHPEDRPLALALEELAFFSRELKILGVYPRIPRVSPQRPAPEINKAAGVGLTARRRSRTPRKKRTSGTSPAPLRSEVQAVTATAVNQHGVCPDVLSRQKTHVRYQG